MLVEAAAFRRNLLEPNDPLTKQSEVGAKQSERTLRCQVGRKVLEHGSHTCRGLL